MDPNKALNSAISTTTKLVETISNKAGSAVNYSVRTGEHLISSGVEKAGKGLKASLKLAGQAKDATGRTAVYLIDAASDKGAKAVDFSAKTIDDTLNGAARLATKGRDSASRLIDLTSNKAVRVWHAGKDGTIKLVQNGGKLASTGISEALRYGAIGVETTFVAGLVVYDNARKITAKTAEITSDKASRAWEASKTAAQDLSWEKVQVQTGEAIDKLGARIAHEQLITARKNDDPSRFADILLRQDGDEKFAKLITEDDAEFFAAAYDEAVQNAERLGTDYAQDLIDAAKPYPILQEAIAQTLENQLNTAHRMDNYGRSPEARQAYRSLALMFNQVGGAAELTARIEPAKLKTVHAAGKKMGYTNEASEILLYARRTNKDLISEFNAQDIAGAVRTQKKELGVDELPDNFQPGKAKVVTSTQDDEIDPTLGMYGPHSWL